MISSRAYVQANKNEIVAQVEREKPWRCSIYGFYYFFRRWPLAIFTGFYFWAVTIAYENISFWWAFLGMILAAIADTHFVPKAADMRQSIESIVHILYFEKFTKRPKPPINWCYFGVFVGSFSAIILGLRFGATEFAFDNFYIYYLIFYILFATILIWWFYKANHLKMMANILFVSFYEYSEHYQEVNTVTIAKDVIPFAYMGHFIFRYYIIYGSLILFFFGLAVLATPDFAGVSNGLRHSRDLYPFLLIWIGPFMFLVPSLTVLLNVKYGMIARMIEAKIKLETSS